MITKTEQKAAKKRAAEMIRQAGIQITEEEADRIEVADFGLSNLEKEGVQVLTLVQTERISVKILVLFPNQTEPEHWHPPVGDDPGKEENCYTVRREIILKPSGQITLAPGEKHWFQARDESAVMYSFSTIARDALDQFTDPNIERITRIVD